MLNIFSSAKKSYKTFGGREFKEEYSIMAEQLFNVYNLKGGVGAWPQ